MPLAGIGYILISHIQPSTRFIYPAVYHPSFANHLLAGIVTNSIGHGKELLNLAKIYTNNTKYNGHNDSFTFKLAIFHDIYSKTNV